MIKVLRASTFSDFDHSLTANGTLVPKLVIAMGRTYDQMLRALRYAAGCRSGDARDYRFAKRTGGLPRAVSVRPFSVWLRRRDGGLDRFHE